MVNYYKQFDSFKKQLKGKKEMSLVEFKEKMMIFFGFGGRNKTIDRWIGNFVDVKYISVKKTGEERNWIVTIL